MQVKRGRIKSIIDCSNIRVGGGMQVAVSFFKDLNEMEFENEEFIFLVSHELNQKIQTLAFKNHIRIIALEAKHSSNVVLRAQQCRRIEKEEQPDCIFVLFGPSYHKSHIPKVVGFARPHYVYSHSPYFDMAPWREKLKMRLLQTIHTYLFSKNSDAIVFETEDAKQIMAAKAFGKHAIALHVVGNTLNNVFLEPKSWVKCQNLVLQNTGFNCLCVSANYTHKNLAILKNVASYLSQKYPDFDFQFTLTLREREFQLDHNLLKYFNLIGPVNHNELPDLYANCDAFILPTLLEVFSTSYLEAMFMKKPILTSDLGFARDTCGDAALYFNPMSAAAIGDAIFRLANDASLQHELVECGTQQIGRFTDSKGRTNAYLDIMHQVIAASHKSEWQHATVTK